jgi:hypothetical protein
MHRITITIPSDLVAAADQRAEELDRSRSWVLVDALRRYLRGAADAHTVREPVAPPYAPSASSPAGSANPVDAAAEVAVSRRRRLRAELALPALERLRRAEELASLGAPRGGPKASAQVVAFDAYDDYYEWKKNRLIRV